MFMFKFNIVAVAICTLGAIGAAQANVVGYCNNYLSSGPLQVNQGLAVSDMTYNGVNANNCYGVSAKNDDLVEINLLWQGGWTLATKSDERNDTGVLVNGVNFAVTETNSGIWTLTATPAALLPDYFDFVGVLKQGNEWAAYLFDNRLVDGADGGTYVITFRGVPTTFDVSHISIYARKGDAVDPPVVINLVPEPSALALAGLALMGAAYSTRRRRSV